MLDIRTDAIWPAAVRRPIVTGVAFWSKEALSGGKDHNAQ